MKLSHVRIWAGWLATGLILLNLAHAGQSTVDPTIPASNSALQSAPIRANFAAAANDINGLIGLNNGTSGPAAPVLGQMWLNTTASPYVLSVWDGDSWDTIGTLNTGTSRWATPIAQGGTGLTASGASGCVLTSTGSVWVCSTPTNTGTVTSVGLLLPSAIFNVTGSPVSTSGTLAASLQTQAINTFFAGPASGGSAQPAFRGIVAADVPTLNQNTTGTAANITGLLAVANGGTGLTGCSTNGYVLTWDTAATDWTCAPSAAGGTVTSVGLALPLSIFTLSGTPVTGSGTLTATLNTEPAGFVWAGPATGSGAAPAFRQLVGTDLPAPGASSLGGVESYTAPTHQFVTGISTSGVPASAQPAFTDVSGSLACSQNPAGTGDVTNPAASCVNTLATVNSNVGTYNYATITVNAKGLVTAAASGTTPLSVLNGFIWGFTLSNDGTSPNTVVDVAQGYASDSANAVMITGTAWTKSTAGTFAAGSGGNGMGTGLTVAASTGYHVFAIECSGSFDVYFDTSITAANKPACATNFRYVGDILTDGSSNIRTFTQTGQFVRYGSGISNLSGGTATSPTAVTAAVPLGVVTLPRLLVTVTQTAVGSGTGANIGGTGLNPIDCMIASPVTSIPVSQQCDTQSNTSGQVFYQVGASTTSTTILTEGYLNPKLAANN